MVGARLGVRILGRGVRFGFRGEEVWLRYGFLIPTGEPCTVAELAREVEEAGWDGAFTGTASVSGTWKRTTRGS